MTRPEILDRSSVEVLVDYRGTDVARARDRGRIPESFSDDAHDGSDRSLRLGRRLGDAAFREGDRCRQSPTPGAEVLGGEVVAEVIPDVVVQPRAREVVEASLPLVAEEPPAAAKHQQLLQRVGELG